MGSVRDVASLSGASFILTVQIALVVRSGVVPRCLERFRALRKGLLLVGGTGDSSGNGRARDDLVAQKVQDLTMQRRLQQAQSFLFPCSIWCSLKCIQMIMNIFLHLPRQPYYLKDVCFFSFSASILALLFSPSWMTRRSIDLCCSYWMCHMVIVVSPLVISKDDLLLMNYAVFGVLRLFLGTCMSLPIFGAWNVVYWLALGSHFLREGTADIECASTVAGTIVTWKVLLQVEASLTVVLLLISLSIRDVMEGEARQQVEAITSRSGLGAAKSLLGTVCDAVVELDGSLKLREHSPSLATLLLHGSSHRLDGAQFDQFMYSDEDKDRLYRCMRNTLHETGAIADAFHVKIRDCLGSAIDMELFHVCFWDSLREVPQHLVGLREHSDLLATPQRLPEHPMEFDIFSQETRETQPELAVVFDALTFKIIQYSWAFAAHFGQFPAGTSLMDWLPPGDPHLGAFCDSVNDFVNSDVEASFFDLGPLNLLLPGADQAGTHASFTLSQRRCGDEDEAQVVACMVLARGPGGLHGRGGGPSCGSRRSRSRRSNSRRSSSRHSAHREGAAALGTAADAGPKRQIGAPAPRTLGRGGAVGADGAAAAAAAP